jgi:hypothetical protein
MMAVPAAQRRQAFRGYGQSRNGYAMLIICYKSSAEQLASIPPQKDRRPIETRGSIVD